MNRRLLFLLFPAVVACGDQGAQLSEDESAINGAFTIDATCPAGVAPLISQSVHYARALGNSPGFRSCIEQAMRDTVYFPDDWTDLRALGWSDHFGPYVPCRDSSFAADYDPLYSNGIDAQVARGVTIGQTSNPLRVGCYADPPGQHSDGDSTPIDVRAGEERIGLSFSLLNSNDIPLTVATILHEVTHQHNYHHGGSPHTASACGATSSETDTRWGQRHTLPYLYTSCALYTWKQSQLHCGDPLDSISCTGGAVAFVYHDDWGDHCTCVEDPAMQSSGGGTDGGSSGSGGSNGGSSGSGGAPRPGPGCGTRCT